MFLVSKLDFCFKFPILPDRSLIMIHLGFLSLFQGVFNQLSVFPNPRFASRFQSFPWFMSVLWHLPWQHLLCHLWSLSPHRLYLPCPKHQGCLAVSEPLRRHQKCVAVPLCIPGPQGILWCCLVPFWPDTVCRHRFSNTAVLSGPQCILKKCAAFLGSSEASCRSQAVLNPKPAWGDASSPC